MHVCSGEDYEDQRPQGEVQGSLFQVPVHAGGHRQGEGGQTEAVVTTRYVVHKIHGGRVILNVVFMMNFAQICGLKRNTPPAILIVVNPCVLKLWLINSMPTSYTA